MNPFGCLSTNHLKHLLSQSKIDGFPRKFFFSIEARSLIFCFSTLPLRTALIQSKSSLVLGFTVSKYSIDFFNITYFELI